MSDFALTRVNHTCLNCGAPVPSPITLCFSCGGTPLVGDPGGEWSVTVDPVPSAKMRRDVSTWIGGLFPGINPPDIERRLAEGQPSVWLTTGLSKVTADSLVQRLRTMHVPATAHLGVPPGVGGARSLVPAIVIGGVAVAVLFWSLWVGLILVMAAIGLVVFRGKVEKSVPLGIPEHIGSQNAELAGQIRLMLEAATVFPADLGGVLKAITQETGALLSILGDEQNAVGYVAGGVDGRIGLAAKRVFGSAALYTNALRQNANPGRGVERLERIFQTLRAVHLDLNALARSPDDEPDLAGRLEFNAQKLESVADER